VSAKVPAGNSDCDTHSAAKHCTATLGTSLNNPDEKASMGHCSLDYLVSLTSTGDEGVQCLNVMQIKDVTTNLNCVPMEGNV
jgi:hypothetical protein